MDIVHDQGRRREGRGLLSCECEVLTGRVEEIGEESIRLFGGAMLERKSARRLCACLRGGRSPRGILPRCPDELGVELPPLSPA